MSSHYPYYDLSAGSSSENEDDGLDSSDDEDAVTTTNDEVQHWRTGRSKKQHVITATSSGISSLLSDSNKKSIHGFCNRHCDDEMFVTDRCVTTTTTSSCSSHHSNNFNNKIILHLDVNCFYCACEQLDRPAEEQLHLRPFAIGQKHIIVTCNYVARREYGIHKLCSREEALQKCPSLLIIEGSDLERYRQHSFRIYQCFRNCLQQEQEGILNSFIQQQQQQQHGQPPERKRSTNASPLEKIHVATRKGGMDEMFADVTQLVDAMQQYQLASASFNETRLWASTLNGNDDRQHLSDSDNIFVYGDNDSRNNSDLRHLQPTILREDQTGATVAIHNHFHHHYGLIHSQEEEPQQDANNIICQTRLWIAARHIAKVVQQRIHEQLGFATSVGISVSPLLAKLASSMCGTNKNYSNQQPPHSLNILYPWRAAHLTLNMPLRKIPQLGHATYRALDVCLMQEFQQQQTQGAATAMMDVRITNLPPFWTCGDLLRVPRDQIIKCLQGVRSLEKSSHDFCTRLLQQCRGVDTTIIVDVCGGLTKTVSVENSFRRGTVCSPASVHQAMAELYVRLPKLLRERQQQSPQPCLAFPTTIRLTARSFVVNESKRQQDDDEEANNSDDCSDDEQQILQTSKWQRKSQSYQRMRRRRRPHVTKSKQAPIDGRRLMVSVSPEEQQALLKRSVAPLLQELVFAGQTSWNITRINLAVTNFADQKPTLPVASSPSKFSFAPSTARLASTAVSAKNSFHQPVHAVRISDQSAECRLHAQQINSTKRPPRSPSIRFSDSQPSAVVKQQTARTMRKNPFQPTSRVQGQSASHKNLANNKVGTPRLHGIVGPSSDSKFGPRNMADEAPRTCNNPNKRRRIDQFFPPSRNRLSK